MNISSYSFCCCLNVFLCMDICMSKNKKYYFCTSLSKEYTNMYGKPDIF